MTPQRGVSGPVEVLWNALEIIADLADFSPLIAIAVIVAVFAWLYSRARRASGAEVVR